MSRYAACLGMPSSFLEGYLAATYLNFVQSSDHTFRSKGMFVQMNGHVSRSEQLPHR